MVTAPLVPVILLPLAVCNAVLKPSIPTEEPLMLPRTTDPALTSLMLTVLAADAVTAEELTLMAVVEPRAPVPIVPPAVSWIGPNN